MRVAIFSTTFVRNISLSKTNSAKYDQWPSLQNPLFWSAFQETSNFLDRFSNTQISNFTKIRPVGAELFHTGGRTDGHDEANSRFSQFC